MDTYLTIAANPFGVPYLRDPSDTNSASYIDLKSEPHRIDEIPEARQWDFLKRLLIRMNTPSSRLMTLGCATFIYPPEQPQRPVWQAHAYIGFCFSDLSANEDAQSYFPLFFHFTQHHQTQSDPNTNIIFELRPTGFYDHHCQGFSVDYTVKSWAHSEAELMLHVTQHMDALHDFLPLMGLTSAA